ncbi:hypothetical protein MTO96_016055 [Rhipicephalus appendiculatus]
MGFVPNDPKLTPRKYNIIYTDCVTCCIFRHRDAGDGYGCTYWRRASTMQEPDDCCKFIYDENCGTSPKYMFYDSSCRM